MTILPARGRKLEALSARRAGCGGGLARHAGRWVLFAVLAFAAAGVRAQILKDPMRPPAEYLAQDPPPDTRAPAAPVLQSVRISGSDRIVVISGKAVREGDKIGSATVAKISDGEVVLKDGDAERVLKLYPAIDKEAVDRRAGAAVRDPADTATRSGRSAMASGGGRR